MSTVYLGPKDFTAEQVAIILEYLNGADDAEAMAERIELEHELDIGVGLARRLIDARERLGGRFETLQQVYNVPYIGPERFTEIAVSLLNLDLSSAPETAAADLQILQNELARLQQQVLKLQRTNSAVGLPTNGAGRVIQLQVLQADVFLGQHVTVEIYAFNRANQTPLMDQAITLSTNWGVLQYQQGYLQQQGSVVEVRTDIEGKARVRLRSPTYETLTKEQQLALEAALMQLDAAAPTPEAIRKQLQTLVLNYRLEVNHELRKAVDIYFNNQKTAILETLNRRFFSDSWQFRHALVSAYLHESTNGQDASQDTGQNFGRASAAGSGPVETLSTVKVRLKDWVGAWYQTYLDYLENGNQFSDRVKTISTAGKDAGYLINGVLREMSRWTLAEPGIAGNVIGEKSTEAAVRKFLADDIQNLPEQHQLQLFSALSAAVKPNAVTQVGTLQAVADTQLTLSDDINKRVGSVEDVATLADNMRQQMAGLESQLGNFQQDIDRFNADYGAFGSSYSQFNSSVSRFNTNYANFNTHYREFSSDYGTFNSQITHFNSDFAEFNTGYKDFSERYNDLDLRVAEMSAQVGSMASELNTVRSDIRTINGELSTVRGDISTITREVEAVQGDISTITRNVDTVRGDIATITRDVDTVLGDIATITRDVDTVRGDISTINTRVFDPNR